MALRDIIMEGDPKLRKHAREVGRVDRRIITVLEDMAETMYDADGIGLAGPQVGVLRRIAVVDVGDKLYELINPVITHSEGEQMICEGCLSVDGKRGYVKRPDKIKVQSLDRAGNTITYEAEGMLAIAMCHEIDHLDGILFIDKIEELTDEEITEIELQNKIKYGWTDDEEADESEADMNPNEDEREKSGK